MKYKIGDTVTLKKGHPCGENRWEILRTGADIKLLCKGCGKQVWLSRLDFDKRIRKIELDGKMISIVHYEPEQDPIEE
ncbi:MAG: DUF951 domain-containing protein [Tissierellia bacterium]|nr:DUF951 domain-containing protein [Tissierellia bacterium]